MKTRVYDLARDREVAIAAAAEVIRSGGLVAFPTETVYGIGADAMNDEAVRRIFAAKGRPADNPLIVHIAHADDADRLAFVTDNAYRAMQAFWPGPLTAVLKSRGKLPGSVSGGLDTVGIRLPGRDVARELIESSDRFIAAPSANLSGKPSPTLAAHVIEDFYGKVPIILDGGPTEVGVESTVCDFTGEIPVILRPGGITREMIRDACGDVSVARAVLEGMADNEKAASPGMKYKHYSPKAVVYVADGDSASAIAKKVEAMYDKCIGAGKKTLILCMKDRAAAYGNRNTLILGNSEADVAHSMFAALREADLMKADVVLFEAVSNDGIGLAVMNRVLRAAAFKVI